MPEEQPRARRLLSDAGDFKLRARLGGELRALRVEAALSLRDLQARTGVHYTEIHRIEGGMQDCRLESFLRIATGLGWSPARVWDDIIATLSGPIYSDSVLQDPDFTGFIQRIGGLVAGHRRLLADVLGNWCSMAARMLASANPVRLAALMRFNIQEVEAPFFRFADRWDRCSKTLERLGLLDSLDAHPIATLRGEGLLTPGTIQGLRAAFVPDVGLAKEKQSSEKGLTSVTPSSKSPAVTGELDSLIDRAKRACLPRGSGGRRRLAKFLGVPMPRISEWLNGTKTPAGDTTLRLLEWVTAEEAKQRTGAAGGSTPTAPKPAKPPKSGGSRRTPRGKR